MFECVSGSMVVFDPHINPVSVYYEKIPFLNEKEIKVRGMLNGCYYAFHAIEERMNKVIGMVIIHSAYSIQQAKECLNITKLGYSSSMMGQAVVAVDEAYRYDTESCYYAIEDDAFYEPKRLLKCIPDMPYTEKKKKQFEEMVLEMQANDSCPTGRNLRDIIQGDPVWEGFKKFGEKSSQWSVEIEKALYDYAERGSYVSFRNSFVLRGGVASMAESGMLSCTSYRNQTGAVYALYISLLHDKEVDMEDPLKYDADMEE